MLSPAFTPGPFDYPEPGWAGLGDARVGIEISQLSVVAVVLPILYLLRKRRWYAPWLMRPASLAVSIWPRGAVQTPGWLTRARSRQHGLAALATCTVEETYATIRHL